MRKENIISVIVILLALAVPTVMLWASNEPGFFLSNLRLYLGVIILSGVLYIFVRLPALAGALATSSAVFVFNEWIWNGRLWPSYFLGGVISFFLSFYVIALYYTDKDRKNILTAKLVRMSSGVTFLGFLIVFSPWLLGALLHYFGLK